jgi:hypothetical protein
MSLSRKEVTGWVVPAFLGSILSVLGWMGSNISEISGSLKAVVVKIDEHDKRLDNQEHRIERLESKRYQLDQRK